MKIWLFNPYGPIPGEGWRDYRFFLIAEALHNRGHQVIWWTANFAHHFKTQRSVSWEDRQIAPGFVIRLVPTCRYYKNIGFKRILFELLYLKNVLARAKRETAPDAIIGADAPQTSGYLARKLAKSSEIPYVIDIMDIWPELFAMSLPRFLRRFQKVFFAPLYAIRRKNFQNAVAVSAVSKSYARLAASEGGKTFGDDASFFYNACTFFDAVNTDLYLRKSTIPQRFEYLKDKKGKKYLIYAGSLGPNYDLHTLLDAAAVANNMNRDWLFLVAGSGPLEEIFQTASSRPESSNVAFLGRVNHEDILALYELCDLVICPYSAESTVSMPAKSYELFSSHLPIVTSLKTDFGEIVTNNDVGQIYEAGNAQSMIEKIDRVLQYSAEELDSRFEVVASRFDKTVEYQRLAEYLSTHFENYKHLKTSEIRP